MDYKNSHGTSKKLFIYRILEGDFEHFKIIKNEYKVHVFFKFLFEKKKLKKKKNATKTVDWARIKFLR